MKWMSSLTDESHRPAENEEAIQHADGNVLVAFLTVGDRQTDRTDKRTDTDTFDI